MSANEGSTAGDRAELLLASCLEAPDPEAAVAAAVEAHPELGSRLASMFAAVRALGLDGAPVANVASVRRLGDFTLLEQLGQGGMGVVYLARQESLDREVALKVIRPERAALPGARARFRREVEAIARLEHPGIVPVRSVGEQDGVLYYTMERIRGQSIAAILRGLAHRDPASLRPADLPFETANARTYWQACAAIAAQVADALGHAHERGVVHRDVKPSNIMVTPQGRAVLLDFGLQRTVEREAVAGHTALTASETAVGTPAYMAPEQLRGAVVDGRTDVYGLGATLFELLALRPPFVAPHAADLSAAILAGGMDGVRVYNHAVGRDLATVCAVALSHDGAHRYPTAAAMAVDLRLASARRPIRARTPGLWLRSVRWMQRHPARAAALALAVALPSGSAIQARWHATELRRESENSDRTLAFLQDLFARLAPSVVRGRAVPTLELVAWARTVVDARFSDDDEARAQVQVVLGEVHLDLERYDTAAELLEAALEKADVLRRDRHVTAWLGLAKARLELADAPGARRAAERAAELCAGDDFAEQRAQAKALWAEAMFQTEQPEAARNGLRAALAESTGVSPLGKARLRHELASSLLELGTGATALDEVEELLAQVVPTFAAELTPPDSELAGLRITQALVEKMRGRPAKARARYEDALAMAEALWGDHSTIGASARVGIARLDEEAGDWQSAAELLEAAVADQVALGVPDDNARLVVTRGDLQGLRFRTGDWQAVARDGPALVVAQAAVFGTDHPIPAFGHVYLGMALSNLGQREAGLAELREAERAFTAAGATEDAARTRTQIERFTAR